MASMPGKVASPDEIERCLKRAYPTRALEDLEVATLDRDLVSWSGNTRLPGP
ncbi:MAG TPA: hypothetical protein VHG08_09335 [Longimicrobium sp.]|nr:hypothetical protein [Longimicrobium sp.]